MQNAVSSQEVAELELALENTRKVPAFRTLLLFYWGLILAKCLLLQWAIIVYKMPFSGFIFVWIPSFLISGAITLVYAMSLFRDLPRMPLSGRLVSATWVGCGVAFILLTTVVVWRDLFSLYLLPAFGALLIGVGCFIHSVTDRARLFKAMAFGWWLSSMWLFTCDGPAALPWTALALYVFLVLPVAWLRWFAHPKAV